MNNAFKFKGCSEAYGEKTTNYIYKGLNVVVSHGSFSYEKNSLVSNGKEVLHISFSSQSGSDMRQKEIDDCLDHFGLDRLSYYFTFEKKSSFPPHNLIRHYEQIRIINKPDAVGLPC